MNMKRIAQFLFVICIVAACQKEPFLQLSSPSSITFTDIGGTQNISMTTNRSWTVSSSESWCKVSPASGEAAEEGTSIMVTCDLNTTYNSRNCSISINAGGITQSIAVSQEANLGLIVSQTSYNLTNEAQSVVVEVRTNVKYTIEVDDSCKDWIQIVSTRALVENQIELFVNANETYENREGHITIKQISGTLSEAIIIKQEGKDGTKAIPIEDPNFKAYLLPYYDDNADGEISFSEAYNITEISVWLKDKITSLQGIEFMPNLKSLECSFMGLNELDVSHNTLLTTLICRDNNISSLDISNNLSLISLNCSFNNLKTIDVSKNSALNDLNCSYNNLTSIDVTKNINLKILYCSNDNLNELNVKNNPYLTSIQCSDNNISVIDVSNNPALTELVCSMNNITNLDISKNTKLKFLKCNSNKISILNVSNLEQLRKLNCSSNQMLNLFVSGCIALEQIDCHDNSIDELVLSDCISLHELNCASNRLTHLDISNNVSMKILYCDDNKLQTLELSNNGELNQLACANNYITSLDITPIKKLLTFFYIPMTDSNGNNLLKTIYCTQAHRAWIPIIPGEIQWIIVDS